MSKAQEKAPEKKNVPLRRGETGETGELGGAMASLANLRREIDRLFHDFGEGFSWRPKRGRWSMLEPLDELRASVWAKEPRVDVDDFEDKLVVSAELPGIDEKDVDVSVSDDYLTIKGEKKSESERKSEGGYVKERTYGSFSRSFRLPESVDRSKIEGQLKKGVLTITLPKSKKSSASRRKISLKSK